MIQRGSGWGSDTGAFRANLFIGIRSTTSMESKVSAAISENGQSIVTGDVPLFKQTTIAGAKGGSETWQEGKTIAH